MLTKIDTPPEYNPKVYVYQRKTTWWWKYQLPHGNWYYCSVGSDESRARKNAKLKERDLIRGLFNQDELVKLQSTGSGPLSIKAAIQRYMDLGPEKTGETKNGENAMLRDCFQFFEVELGVSEFHKITEKHLIAYRDGLLKRISRKELKPISANNKIKSIRKVFRWFKKKRKEIEFNPAEDLEPIEVKKGEKARSVTLTIDQIRQVVSAPYHPRSGFNVKAFFMLMYATGLRSGEVRHLEWTDVDWLKRVIRLRTKPNCPTKYGLGWSPKWEKDRDVYLNDAALMLLKGLPRVESVGYVKETSHPAQFIFVTLDKKRSKRGCSAWKRIDNVRSSWKKLLEVAGVWTPENEGLIKSTCPFHRHDVRRTWNVHAKANGVFSLDEASHVLGHDPAVNLQHYGTAIPDDQISAKMQQHPSNELIGLCYNAVTRAKNDNQKGGQDYEAIKATV